MIGPNQFLVGVSIAACAFVLGCNGSTEAQRMLGVSPGESGVVLMREQAAYNVHHYVLDLQIDPDQRSIDGHVEIHADVVHPIDWLVLDLDTLLTVHAVLNAHADSLVFHHTADGRIWSFLGRTLQPGEQIVARIAYGGVPREAPRPPWVGGFVWAETPDGAPWIGVACQADGADIWWPVKDHPSDRPDSVLMRITVPRNLQVAANGRFRGSTEREDGWTTFEWFTSTPINNYAVSVNIAPYEVLETSYESVAGEAFPVFFWVLEQYRNDAERMLPQFLDHMRFFEDLFGPYPFRADKYGIAHVPYLGMEHQTIIAYGSTFSNNEYGFDWLHHHELAHEWWGNMVTVTDWRDFWIHEGFATYAQNLYAEHLGGRIAYHRSMSDIRPRIENAKPVAPRESMSTREMYFVPPDYVQSDNDIYFKGAWILHSLRYLIGEEAFFEALRRMAYPDPAMERVTDGSHARFASSDEIQHIAEGVSGRDLGWFFEAYLRHAELPVLHAQIDDGSLQLLWETPAPVVFEMPVEVQAGAQRHVAQMTGGSGSISLPPGVEPVIDPDHWILREMAVD